MVRKLLMLMVAANATLGRCAGDDDLELKLAASRGEFLLGEPVVVTGSLVNTGQSAIVETPVHRLYPYEDTFLSSDGKEFAHYAMGIFGCGKVVGQPATLNAGQAWDFEKRILYAFERKSKLAFEKPGDYFIKIRYPLISKKWRRLESNTIKVHIRRPEGSEAEVFATIRAPEVLYFLQSGLLEDGHEDVPATIIELLRSFPETTYRPALEWALSEYYKDRRGRFNRDEALADKELTELREVLKIEEPLPGPFPDDGRLDVKVSHYFPKSTPLNEVLDELSKQSGIPLGLHPELRIRSLTTARNTCALRTFMGYLDAFEAAWVPDGKGYYLIPVSESPPDEAP